MSSSESERDEKMDQLFLDFCLMQEIHPESVEAAVRFEGWYAERAEFAGDEEAIKQRRKGLPTD